MADTITAPKAEKSIEKDSKLKRLQKDSLAMYSASISCGKLSDLLRIGFVFNYHNSALYRLEGFKSFGEWLQANGIAESTGRRYKAIGEAMQKFCGAEDDQDFTFNIAVIKEHFGESIKNHDLTIHGLAAAARDQQQFQNYLSGQSDINTTEALKLVAPSVNGEQVKQLAEKDSSDLLSRMKEKGYVWSAVNKRFENPDGSPLSLAQIGEFVSEDDVMGFVRQTKDSVESFKKTTATRIGSYSIFFEAFLATSHSPESKRKLSEEVESLVKEAQTLSGEILELLPEEPTHA